MNIILICIALAVFSLICVSYINSQQTRKRLIHQRLIKLKRNVAEQEELAVALGSLTGSAAVERIVLDDMLDTLRGMQQLTPNDQSLNLSIENALQRAEEIASASYSPSLYRLMESDAGIAKAQYQLGEAACIVRKRQAAGHIELAEMTGFIEELAWAHMAVTVISLTAHGHKAVRGGDVLRGHSYYKKAQETAMASTLSDDRRHQFIKELGDIMNNKRKSLSTHLMPETLHNPDNTESANE